MGINPLEKNILIDNKNNRYEPRLHNNRQYFLRGLCDLYGESYKPINEKNDKVFHYKSMSNHDPAKSMTSSSASQFLGFCKSRRKYHIKPMEDGCLMSPKAEMATKIIKKALGNIAFLSSYCLSLCHASYCFLTSNDNCIFFN